MACCGKIKVNRGLLPVKAVYFFIMAGVGSLFRYITVFMRELGLSPSECALILGIAPFLSAVSRMMFGNLADRLNRHTLVMLVLSVISVSVLSCLLFIPPVRIDNSTLSVPVQLHCDDSSAAGILTYCDIEGVNCIHNVLLSSEQISDTQSDIPSANSAILNCDLTCNVSLSDSICMGYTGSQSCPISIIKHSQESIGITDSHCKEFSIVHATPNTTALAPVSCSSNASVDCQLECNLANRSLQSSDAKCATHEEHEEKYSLTFWLVTLIYLIGTLFHSSIPVLTDALTYIHLGEERGKWGNQRVFGTIGFALFATISGVMMDVSTQKGERIDYTPGFVLFIVLTLLGAVSVCFYKRSDSEAHSSAVASGDICSVIRSPTISCTLVLLFMFGILTGVMDTFLFWHLQELGAPQLLLGLTLLFSCLPEIVVLYVSGRIIDKLGEVNCFYMVCFAYCARFLGYSFLVDPWWVLAVEPLHGITFAVGYAAATSHGSRHTPPGMHGTMQAIINAVNFGFGKGFGSLIAGEVFETWGAVITFQACAVLAFLSFLAYLAAQCCMKAHDLLSPRPEHKAGSDEDEAVQLDTKVIAEPAAGDTAQPNIDAHNNLLPNKV